MELLEPGCLGTVAASKPELSGNPIPQRWTGKRPGQKSATLRASGPDRPTCARRVLDSSVCRTDVRWQLVAQHPQRPGASRRGPHAGISWLGSTWYHVFTRSMMSLTAAGSSGWNEPVSWNRSVADLRLDLRLGYPRVEGLVLADVHHEDAHGQVNRAAAARERAA